MKLTKEKLLRSLHLLVLFVSLSSWAGDLPTSVVIDAKKAQGKPWFVLMTERGGIADEMDRDVNKTFTVADRATILKTKEEFDPSVYKKVIAVFKGGEKDLLKLVDWLQTQPPVTAMNFKTTIGKGLDTLNILKNPSERGLAPFKIAPFLGLSSGSGTRVDLGNGNYFLNYGYEPDSKDRELEKKALKSGRSSGVSAGRKVLDASDPYYLKSLKQYLKETPDPRPFVQTLMEILVKSDTRGLSKLSEEGQALATDFIAVYTAELRRHIIAGLGNNHPWENDLAEATFVSLFVTQTDKVALDGKLVAGEPLSFFATGTGGAGLGRTRLDRRSLQQGVTNVVRERNPALVDQIGKYIEMHKDADVFRTMLEFFNNAANQDEIIQDADKIIAHFTDFAMAVHADSKHIQAELLKNGVPKPCTVAFGRVTKTGSRR